MKKLILALVVALLASLVLPTASALADSPLQTFTATATLTQTLSGTVAFYPWGVTLTGEQFAGTFTGGSGPHSNQLVGSSVTVTQNATLYYTGYDPYTGTISFAGPVGGTFIIQKQTGKKAHTLTGSYGGMVSGTLTPTPFGGYFLGGTNSSQWAVTDTTDMFNSLRRASGSLSASLGGVFPGYEIATVTISGTSH